MTAARRRTSPGSSNWSRTTAEALENRAAARSILGEFHLSREDYDALIRLVPDNAVALYSRGACLAQMGDLAGAVADFERAIALEPGDAVPYYNRGSTSALRTLSLRTTPICSYAIGILLCVRTNESMVT